MRAFAVVDEISSRDHKVGTANGEGQVRKAGDIARDGVGTIIVISSTIRIGNLLGNGVSEQQESGASVNNTAELVNGSTTASRATIDVDGVPALRVIGRDLGEGTGDLACVDATEEVFTTTTLAGLSEPDAKDGVGDQTLRDQVVHGGLGTSHGGDGVETQTEETIGGTLLELRGFTLSQFNTLVLDGQTTNGDSIDTSGTARIGSITVANSPALAFVLVGGGLAGVELGLSTAASGAEGGGYVNRKANRRVNGRIRASLLVFLPYQTKDRWIPICQKSDNQ